MPPISIIRESDCDVPLFTVTLLNTVSGDPPVLVIEAELLPKKVTSQ